MRQNLNSAPVCRSARPRSSRAKSSRRARTRSGRLGCNRIELQKNALKTLDSLSLPWGFEPLISAVQAPARLTGSSLPFLSGSSATSATAGAGLSPTPVPAPCVANASNVSPVSTRTAWLPVAASKAARSHRRRADRARRRGRRDRSCRRR